MQSAKQTRPLGAKTIMALLIFLAVGGIPSGLALMADPSGRSMGLPLSLLEDLPVHDFTLIGLWLFFVYGLIPLIVAYGLWTRKTWSRMGAVILGMILIIWTGFETILWGSFVLMMIYGALGFAMLCLSLLPSVKRHLAL